MPIFTNPTELAGGARQVARAASLFVLTADGDPALQTVTNELRRELGPRFAVQWHKYLREHQVTQDWAPNDPRHQLVQQGLLGDTRYEILLRVPQSVGRDEIVGYVVAHVEQFSCTPGELRRILDDRQAKLDAERDAHFNTMGDQIRDDWLHELERPTIANWGHDKKEVARIDATGKLVRASDARDAAAEDTSP